MWKTLLIWSLSFSAFSVRAADVLHPLQMQVRPGDKLKILGVHGHLKLIRDARFKNLQFEVVQHKSRLSADWNLSLERRGSTLEVEVFSVASPNEWRREVTGHEWPDYDIFIRGPSLPVTVSWRQGVIDVLDWDQKLDISLLDGSLNVQSSKGYLTAQGGRLNMVAHQFNGQMRFQADSGQLRVERSGGILKAQLMDGMLSLADFQGELDWTSERANFAASSGRGKWTLKSQSGSVDLDRFEGTLKGSGETGKWRVSAADRSEVDIQSSSGPVKVRWNKGSAKAFLTSHSGKIHAPSFVPVQRESGASHWLAQWGQGQLGQIFVKTQTGSISLMK